MTRRCKLKDCREKLPKGIASWVDWCSPECGTKLALAKLEKQRAMQERSRADSERQKRYRQKKVFKENDLPHQKELTRKVFNEMIRLLDRGKRCPTCGEPLVDGSYDAGHVRTVASCPQLRYDARACFGQCRACNGSGTIRRRARKTQEVVSEIYKGWILETFGQAHYDWLYGPHPTANFTCADLIAMRAVFAAERTRLKKGLPPSRDWRKLPEQLEIAA